MSSSSKAIPLSPTRLDQAYILVLADNAMTNVEIQIIEWGVDLRLWKERLDAEVPPTYQRS